MILINCACGKSIAAKPEWAGISIRCAGCGRSHYLNADAPAAKPVVVDAEAAPPTAKACPHCAGQIQPAAIKCRHCGRMVQDEPIRVVATPVAAGPTTDAGGVGTLMVGLLSWIFLCWLPSPIAWIMGAVYESDCRARGVEPSGAGKVGKVLGIIGTLLLLLGAAAVTLLLVAGSAG
ncbi:MAG TPA: hypothetical protein VF950_15435 [Planctomycetota bacterium]